MSSLFEELAKQWDQNPGANLCELIASAGEVSLNELAILVSEDQRRQCLAGRDKNLEGYLADFPQLAEESTCLDLMYNEIILREERGEVPTPGEYVSRFPDLKDAIERQFQLHQLLNAQAESSVVPENAAVDSRLPAVEGFELIEIAGRGAMGVVYKARDLNLNRTVAIKMLIGGQHTTEKQREQLRRESESAAKLQHRGIVVVHQVGATSQAVPFLVMEYVSGGTLANVLSNGPLPATQAVRIGREITAAIAYAHERQLIHRDLKPGNVLIGPDGPLVADFGLSRRADTNLTADSISGALGTPQYMAPEQANPDTPVGPTADIYAIGAILYEMLSGRPPLLGSSPWEIFQQLATHEPPRLRELNPAISRDLETICQRCLQKDPARRYQSAEELGEDLRRYSEDLPITARPVGAFERVVRWCRREPKLALSIGTAAVMVAGMVAVSTAAVMRIGDARLETRSAEAVASEARVLALLNAAPDAIPLCIENLDAADPATRSMLEDSLASDAETEASIQFRAACGLAAIGEVRPQVLLDAFGSIPPSRGAMRSAAVALRSVREQAGNELSSRVQRGEPGARVRFACLAMFLGDLEPATGLVAPVADPTTRTLFIHSFPNWVGDESALPGILEGAGSDLAAAVCLGVGNIDPLTLHRGDRDNIVETMQGLHRDSPNGSVHAASGWALRKWGKQLPEVQRTDAEWKVNSLGMVMIPIAPAGLTMGGSDRDSTAYEVTVTRKFMMSNRETSRSMMAAFAKSRTPEQQELVAPDTFVSPSPPHPAQNMSWTNAVRFCNWLSKQEGLEPCYSETKETHDGKSLSRWTCSFDSSGYRLPTEAEWELACRAGSAARYSFGNDQLLEPQYARSSNRRPIPTLPCGSLMPNAFGLFDMHGNVWEYCWDEWSESDGTPVTDPTGPGGDTGLEGTRRLIRGGGVFNSSGDSDAEARGWHGMNFRSRNCGFRVVRTQNAD